MLSFHPWLLSLALFFTQSSAAQLMELGRNVAGLSGSSISEHVCARFEDGTAKCWGRNDEGQLGQGDRFTRPVISGGLLRTIADVPAHSLLQVTAGQKFSCARMDDGSVYCWGSNANRQLGVEMVSSAGGGSNEMGRRLGQADLGPGRWATDIASGRAHTCAVRNDGTVICWGANEYGQLGHNVALIPGQTPIAVNIGAGRSAKRVVAGDDVTCALRDDATVVCWGQNLTGAVAPYAIPNNRLVVDLSAGNNTLCVVLDDGRVGCATVGSALASTLPVDSGRKAVAVWVGTRGACFGMDNGVVKCQDTSVFLGSITWTVLDPGAGRVIADVTQIVTANCFVRDDGTAACLAK